MIAQHHPDHYHPTGILYDRILGRVLTLGGACFLLCYHYDSPSDELVVTVGRYIVNH